jgi:nitrogenase molybdenum-iron protein NifN
MCTPLGAALAAKGVKGAITLLHGSQGCSTYIRRYMISHFREPIDIASSNFSEESAVFGGKQNLVTAIRNVTAQYHPAVIVIATTCLSETIGDDISMIIKQAQAELGAGVPPLVHVSTPSYRGASGAGFHDTVAAIVKAFAVGGERLPKTVAFFPGIVSCEDLREFMRIADECGVTAIMPSDYSETLDGGLWSEHIPIPEGGTTLDDIARLGHATHSVTCGVHADGERLAGTYLEKTFGVAKHVVKLPIGIAQTDAFLSALTSCGGEVSVRLKRERARLADAYVDGHKYLFGKRVVISADDDLAESLAGFAEEVGMLPVVIAKSGEDADHEKILAQADAAKAELIIGSSKALYVRRKLGIPLVRVGMPVHDRIGGQRILTVGYRGTLRLFDEIVNTVLAERQDAREQGFTYI